MAFGWPTVGLFVPATIALFYISISAWRQQILTIRHFFVATTIFLIGFLPFAKSFNQQIKQNWWDDGYRYSVTARNMVNSKTLWGGDSLINKNDGITYRFQPGYRYFLALEYLIFAHENRLFQITNLAIWCIAIFLLLKKIQQLSMPPLLFKIILIFLFGASVYAFKNILMGLSEWLFVLFILIFTILFLDRRTIPAICFLALAAFIRQNQLPAVLLLFIFGLVRTNQKILASVLFICILMLPLYHNLYYAHSPAFFANYSKYPILVYHGTGHIFHDFLFMVRNTSLHYIGFDWQRSMSTNFFGVIFIPTGVCMIILMFLDLHRRYRILFVVSLILILASSVILNYAYFPRFEFANLMCGMVSYIILRSFQDEGLITWRLSILKPNRLPIRKSEKGESEKYLLSPAAGISIRGPWDRLHETTV